MQNHKGVNWVISVLTFLTQDQISWGHGVELAAPLLRTMKTGQVHSAPLCWVYPQHVMAKKKTQKNTTTHQRFKKCVSTFCLREASNITDDKKLTLFSFSPFNNHETLMWMNHAEHNKKTMYICYLIVLFVICKVKKKIQIFYYRNDIEGFHTWQWNKL